ncbi:MAG: tryptophan-rich sensory protein [Candidatus Pacebacteria bacterium]|nr:tryptophan-rich sensory protein [Candidatus Paceibacterota bacterium]
MKIKNIFLLIGSIFISQLAGIIGAFATVSSVSSWYITLNKPFFNPPSWVFGPVWTTLYTMMGIAFFLILLKKFEKKTKKKKKYKNLDYSIKLFLIHLVFNTAWSLVFFGAKSLGLALVIILVLWAMIVCLIKNFYKINKWAAYLLVPYLLWVSFATLLNLSIFILNI